MGNKDKNNGTLSLFLQLQFSIVHMPKSNLIILLVFFKLHFSGFGFPPMFLCIRSYTGLTRVLKLSRVSYAFHSVLHCVQDAKAQPNHN